MARTAARVRPAPSKFGARGKPKTSSGTGRGELRGQVSREAALFRWGFTAKPF